LPDVLAVKIKRLAPALFAAAFLVLAVSSHWPYAFYVLMRLTVCAISLYLAHNSSTSGRVFWVWVLGAVALLFNPIFPMRMHRSDWSYLNMIAASLLALWAITSLVGDRKGSPGPEQTYGK
jgi:hypothetical protein